MRINYSRRGRFARYAGALAVSTVLASSLAVIGVAGVASATSTITEATGFPVSNEAQGLTSLNVTTQTAGDLVIFQSQIHSTSISVTGVASSTTAGTTGTWHLAERYVDTTNNVITEEVWWAVVGTPGAMTITATYSASVGSIFPELVADSFTTSGASTWNLVTGGGNAGTNTSGINFPSIASDPVDASQVYWGYVESTYTATAGTTPNFTYKPTSQGNLTTFDDQLASNTAYAPNATAYPPGNAGFFTSIGTIFSATPTSSSGFTVTFNGNGSTGGAMGPETASTPSFLTTNAFVRTGYTFAGWNTAALGTGTAYADGSTYTFTSSGSATLYAQWTPNPTYTVTFNQNGGTGTMLAQSGNYLQPLTANILTKTGATFAGWNTALNGTGTAYADQANYPFTASVTLYAQWNVIVTFNGNTSTSGSMTPQTNSKATPLTANAFVKTGYAFAGWNTVAGGTGTAYADGASFPFALATTLYAQWTVAPSFTVTFNGNGSTSGTMANETNNSSTALTANSYLRTGYTFTGWNTVAGGTGTAYADGATYPFTASTTLYAQWSAAPMVTVTFNGNGSTSGSMAPQTNNFPTALTANGFSKTGYVFSAWTTTPSGGSSYANGASYPFSASITLYAQWSVPVVIPPAPASSGFSVIFDGNGSTSGIMGAETNGAPAPLSANAFVRTGYSFTGWNTAADGSGTAYAAGATYPFSANAVLYAQWSAPVFSVTFDGNGSTSGIMGAETNSVPAPLSANAFVRTGYSFTGWNTAANGSGTVYAAGATFPFSFGLTLYAQWTANFNTVTFIGNGANHGSMKSEVANVPTALTPNVFTRTGFNFAGWNTAANGTGTKYANHANYSFGAKLNLYAQWMRVLNPAPRVIRIVGTFAAGTTHMVMIVGTGLAGTAKVLTNAPGTTISILNVKNTHIDARVTVKKGTRPGVHVLTVVLHNGRSCTISYLSR